MVDLRSRMIVSIFAAGASPTARAEASWSNGSRKTPRRRRAATSRAQRQGPARQGVTAAERGRRGPHRQDLAARHPNRANRCRVASTSCVARPVVSRRFPTRANSAPAANEEARVERNANRNPRAALPADIAKAASTSPREKVVALGKAARWGAPGTIRVKDQAVTARRGSSPGRARDARVCATEAKSDPAGAASVRKTSTHAGITSRAVSARTARVRESSEEGREKALAPAAPRASRAADMRAVEAPR